MENLEIFGQVVSYADHLTTVVLLLVIVVTGVKKLWVWGYQLTDAKARIAELQKDIDRKDAKLDAQERLIDRLSGVADRTTEMATVGVVRHIREHRGMNG